MLTVRGHNRLGVLVAGTEPAASTRRRTGRSWLMVALAGLSTTRPRAGRRARRRTRTSRPRCSGCSVGAAAPQPGRRDLRLPRQRRLGRTRCGALALRHQVVAVHVTDPRELELPPVGMLAVVDTETGRQRYVQTLARAACPLRRGCR